MSRVAAPAPLAALAAVILAAAVGCSPTDDGSRSGAAAGPAPTIARIPRSFLARHEGQDWLEQVTRAEVGDRFLVHFQPRLRAPAEGPWTLTITPAGEGAGGKPVLEERGVRVDGATGRITLLVQTAQLPAGEYRITMDLEEGGMASGPPNQAFRFAID